MDKGEKNMIKRVTNKVENFYQYMGKFFGSRLIEKQINDRIYDDEGKIWYIYLEEGKVMAFVSIKNNIIKNIYTTKEKYLEEILVRIKKENEITYSIVPNCYKKLYERCGFQVSKNQDYKNFVTIYMDKPAMMLID